MHLWKHGEVQVWGQDENKKQNQFEATAECLKGPEVRRINMKGLREKRGQSCVPARKPQVVRKLKTGITHLSW